MFHKFPKEENLKQQPLIKIKRRNIESIQHVKMCHTYCFGLNPGKRYDFSWREIRLSTPLIHLSSTDN